MESPDMSAHIQECAFTRVDADLFTGEEHLRPAWHVVVVTIVLVAASVLVLTIAG
jgi:hypothetical protein